MAQECHGYEFGGPIGALGVSFGLPIIVYLASFLCNDVSGCPVPSALSPSTLTLEKLKRDVNWPAEGIWGLFDTKVTRWVLGYYFLSLALQAALPGDTVEGVELASGGRLRYKFNSFSSSVFTLAICLAGTVAQGADFPLWTFIWDNYVQIITANLLVSLTLATYVYINSFSTVAGNAEKREVAAGGHSGNLLYDWFIGRELNPRVNLPLLGEIDIKAFMEMRPGLLGWIIMDLTFMAHQYKTHGYVSDSMFLITAFQAMYVLDAHWMEPSILTTMDLTTDGFGFMLAFGDVVWVPFTYSIQTKYLAVYPVNLGLSGSAGVLAILGLGYFIFRSSNNEKNRFRTDPSDPRVAHLKYMETKSGSKLLVSGWWGTARHINYFGDWIMAWSYSLPTGIAGYVIQHTNTGNGVVAQAIQGEARGWGMIVTYFYVVYFAVLLVHREMRDEEKCMRKYGDDWEKYRKLVPYRIIPYVY